MHPDRISPLTPESLNLQALHSATLRCLAPPRSDSPIYQHISTQSLRCPICRQLTASRAISSSPVRLSGDKAPAAAAELAPDPNAAALTFNPPELGWVLSVAAAAACCAVSGGGRTICIAEDGLDMVHGPLSVGRMGDECTARQGGRVGRAKVENEYDELLDSRPRRARAPNGGSVGPALAVAPSHCCAIAAGRAYA